MMRKKLFPPIVAPRWEVTDSYCQTDSHGKNTGVYIEVLTDTNERSLSYKKTKEVSTYDTDKCPVENTDPIWEVISTECTVVEYSPSGEKGFDGTATVISRDVNPESESYNETKTEIIPSDECPIPDTEAQWTEIGRVCEQVEY